MDKRAIGITIIDLFCGAGGFSEGFYQAGFDVVLGIDNWKPACETHETNSLGETRNIDLLKTDVDDVLLLKENLERKYGEIDIVIGSPPCTEFSYAKNGGKGDTEKGMVLVRRHLLFAALFKPRYWLMENVPRLEQVLNTECAGSRDAGWTISYEKLGISRNRFRELGLESDSLRIPNGIVLTASDFGTHQKRERFIAGCFPSELLDEQKVDCDTDVSLGGLIATLNKNLEEALKTGRVEDPNYPHHKVDRSMIRDYDYDTSLHPMYWEETRHLKRRHIQYGRMCLPEDLSAPARTIMATYNASSREALILETPKTVFYHGKERKVFRQPTVREVACIQGFPLGFQFAASRMNDRYKLIGNAVPCQLAYALGKSISEHIRKSSESGSEGFVQRANVTFARQKANHYLPIMPKPLKIVDEAGDAFRTNKEFRAKPTKLIRRKLLSSELQGSSCEIIFENTSIRGDDIVGGNIWKSCLQKGVGKTFHKVYMDEVSCFGIINAFNNSFNVEKRKALLRCLKQETDKGIPVLTSDWVELPRWSEEPDKYLHWVTEKRMRVCNTTTFQALFTEDREDIDDCVSPIDFFDGLDAIMLSAFCRNEFNQMHREMVNTRLLHDNGHHSQFLDSRIIPNVKDAQIPFVTMAAGLLSIQILWSMYRNDVCMKDEPYYSSLRSANQCICEWLSS